MDKLIHLVPKKKEFIVRGVYPDRRAKPTVTKTTYGVLVRKESLWIGAHYSPTERRWCINLLPCITIFIVFAGGNLPRQKPKWG